MKIEDPIDTTGIDVQSLPRKHRALRPVLQVICAVFLGFGCGGCDDGAPYESKLQFERQQRQLELERQERQEAEQEKAFWECIAVAVGLTAVGLGLWATTKSAGPHQVERGKGSDDAPPATKFTDQPYIPIVPSAPQAQSIPSHRAATAPITVVLKGRHFFIDGLNVCRIGPSERFHIQPLLVLAIYLVEQNANFTVLFDANASHVAFKYGNRYQQEAVQKLLGKYPGWFAAVPGGSRADDFILSRSSSTGGEVISNDRFRQEEYLAKYPWIKDAKRLHKAIVLNRVLSIPSLGIDIPVEQDIYTAGRKLCALLDQNCPRGKTGRTENATVQPNSASHHH